MELSFRTRELRLLCEDSVKAESVYGSEVADFLRRRLSDLYAARTVSDLVAGRPSFADDHGGELLVVISGSYEIRCRPNHVDLTRGPDGSIDWGRVHRIQIVSIGDGSQ